MIVTPDAVLAIIEVKTELRTENSMAEALRKFAEIKKLCHSFNNHCSIWSGLFIYQGAPSQQKILLEALAEAYLSTDISVNCVTCGKDVFARYWPNGDEVNSPIHGQVWHSYVLPGVSPSYFIGNVIDALSLIDNSESGFAWFPLLGGKEKYRTYGLQLGKTTPIKLYRD